MTRPRAPGASRTRLAVARGSLARELALCALEEVVLLATGARTPPPAGHADARIRRAEELIAADPGAPHTVGSLAKSGALSPSRFAHLFTLRTGLSPMRAFHFSRVFRERQGVPPGAYRAGERR